jgi:hypothetical protein
MKMQSSLRAATLILSVIALNHAPLYGQTPDSTDKQTQDTLSIVTQSAGWGITNTVGDASQYLNSLTISTFYGVRLGQMVEVAATLSFSDYSLNGQELFYDLNISSIIPTIRKYSSLTHSLTGDISLILSPFAGDDWRRLRFHLGASVRRAGRISSRSTMSLDSSRRYSSETYTKQVALGGHVAIEYLLPIASTVDIGVRLQMHAYLAPFWVEGENVLLEYLNAPGTSRYGFFPNGGAAGLSAFLRVNF